MSLVLINDDNLYMIDCIQGICSTHLYYKIKTHTHTNYIQWWILSSG